jgi:hypothetical protein
MKKMSKMAPNIVMLCPNLKKGCNGKIKTLSLLHLAPETLSMIIQEPLAHECVTNLLVTATNNRTESLPGNLQKFN